MSPAPGRNTPSTAGHCDVTFGQSVATAVLEVNVDEGSTADERQQEGDQGPVSDRNNGGGRQAGRSHSMEGGTGMMKEAGKQGGVTAWREEQE